MSKKLKTKKRYSQKQVHRSGFSLVATLQNEDFGVLKVWPAWKETIKGVLADKEVRHGFADSWQDRLCGQGDDFREMIGFCLAGILKYRPELLELAQIKVSDCGRVEFSK